MKLIRRLSGGTKTQFGGTGNGWDAGNFWAKPFGFLGKGTTGDREWVENDFVGYVQQIYKDNGVAFACIQTRALVFSEARLVFQRLRDGKPGKDGPPDKETDDKPKTKADDPKTSSDAKKPPKGKKKDDKKRGDRSGSLFSTQALKPIEQPWPGGFLGNLLFQMDVDASLAGNSYWTWCDDKGKYGNAAKGSETARIVRMRPDFVQLIIYSRNRNPWALDAKLAGFLYKPFLNQGSAPAGGQEKAILLMPDEVCHYAPIQDPEAHFRGMSWLQPVLRELGADKAAMTHKKRFFDNGATLSNVVSLSEEVGQEDFEFFLAKFKEEYEGVDNAYKTLVLGGGADVSTIGADLKQLDFTQTQGHGETRVAAASGVPPVIVGLSEGLQAATYSNYGQARRRFADGTLRPLWRMACGALSKLVDVPDDARLWFDERDVSFLRDDQKDEAEISETDARAAKALIEAGYEPDTVTEYLETRDPTVLEHTGLVSVQLLQPGQLNPMGPMGGMGGPGMGGAPGGQPRPGGGQPRPAAGGAGAKPAAAKPAAKKPAARKPSGGKRYVRD